MTKPNGFSLGSKQNLTGGLDFYTVYTTVDITPTSTRKYNTGTLATNYLDTLDLTDPATLSQYNLDRLVETIALRGQPVFYSGVSTVTALPATVTDMTPASGATIYTIQFAIEHNFAWDVDPSTIPNLPESLNGVGSFVYTGTAGASTNTVSVVKNASYSNDYNVNISNPPV